MKKQLLLGALLGCIGVGVSIEAGVVKAVKKRLPGTFERAIEGAKTNNIVYVQQYLDKGGDVNRGVGQDTIYLDSMNGPNLLDFAAEHNSLDVAELLIKKGADVDLRDRGAGTPLFYAVRHNSLDVAELLIEKGATVNAKSWGKTPLELTQEGSQIWKLLKKHGGKKAKELPDYRPPMDWE